MSTYEAIDLMINAIGTTLLFVTVIVMIVEMKTKK